MVESSLPAWVTSSDGSLVGVLTVVVAVAVTVGTDCAVTPRSLLAANNNAPMSSAAKAMAASARYPKRFFFGGV
jgi:hypothetical protein